MSENADENTQNGEEEGGILQSNVNSLAENLGIKDSTNEDRSDLDFEDYKSNDKANNDNNQDFEDAEYPESNNEAKVKGQEDQTEQNIVQNNNKDNEKEQNSLENKVSGLFNNLAPQPVAETNEQENENGALEPILPPIHDLHSPNYDERSQTTPTSTSNIGILPPPQRRRSPTAARRSLKATNNYHNSNNDSFRKKYKLLQPSPPTYDEESLMNRILKGETPTVSANPSDSKSITPDQLNRFIILFQEKRKEIARKYNYQEGIRINEAISRLENLRNGYLAKMTQDESLRTLNEEYEQFEQRRNEYDDKTNTLIKDLQEQQEKQRTELKANHEAKEEDLLQTWGSSKKLRMYNRSSAELTTLRRQHAFLLVQNRFQEAKKIAAEIEVKQNYELQVNHQHHQKDYDSAYASLQEKNREEVETFENKCAIDMATLIQNRKRGRKQFESKEQWFTMRRAEISESTSTKTGKAVTSPKTAKMTTRSTLYDSPHSKPIMPSSKMTRKELGGFDVVILKLPPIQNRKINTRKQSRNPK